MEDATYSADQIERLLKCPVCLDRYNQPKILPCQHTFCKTPCLQGLIRASDNRFIKCPECRAQHLVPREGIDGFSTNITVSGFLDLQATVSQTQNLRIAENGSPHSASPNSNKCAVCDAEVELCICHHCDKRICNTCQQSHVRQLRLDLSRVVNQLRRKVPQVSDLVGQVEQCNEQLRANVESVKAEINNAVEKHVKELEDRQNVLNTELEITLQTEVRSLRLHQENLEVELASIASFCDSTEGAVTRGSAVPDTDLIAMRQQSSQLMEQCGNLVRQPAPQPRRFRFDYSGQNVTNAIMSLGEVRSGSANRRTGETLSQRGPWPRRNGRENVAFIAPIFDRGNSDLLMPLTRSPPGVPARRGQSSNADMLRQSESNIGRRQGGLYRNQPPPNLRRSHMSNGDAQSRVRHRPPAIPSSDRLDHLSTSRQTPSSDRFDSSFFSPPARPVREIGDDEERAFAGFISFSNPNFRGNRNRRRQNDNNRRGQNVQNSNSNESVNPPRREGTFTLDLDPENAGNPHQSGADQGPTGQVASLDSPHTGEEAGSSNIVNTTDPSAEAQAAADGIVPVHGYRQKTRVLRRIGSRGSTNGKFTWPRGVAVVPQSDNICVADSSNHRVQIFTKEGQFIRAFGSYGQNPGEFDCLTGIAVMSSGNIVISDRYNHRIQIFNNNGRFIREFGSEGESDGNFSYPWGVCCDQNDFIYVCDKENNRIQKFQADGTFIRTFGQRGNSDGQFENPHYIAANDSCLVVSDSGNHRIQIFDFEGNHKLTFGVEGSERGNLKYPKGVAVDQQGFILVGNSGNKRVDVFKDDGAYYCTIWRSGEGNQMKSLDGVALMASGRVIICDRENHNLSIY